MAQAGMQVPTYAYAANNPLRYVDPTGLLVELYCEPIWGHGVFGAGRHCYLRVQRPESDGYDVTVEIYGPQEPDEDRSICAGTPRGRPREQQNNPWRNSAFGVVRAGSWSSDDGSLEDAVLNEFYRQAAQLPPYGPFGPNSNTFVESILNGVGVNTTKAFPFNAPGVTVAPF